MWNSHAPWLWPQMPILSASIAGWLRNRSRASERPIGTPFEAAYSRQSPVNSPQPGLSNAKVAIHRLRKASRLPDRRKVAVTITVDRTRPLHHQHSRMRPLRGGKMQRAGECQALRTKQSPARMAQPSIRFPTRLTAIRALCPTSHLQYGLFQRRSTSGRAPGNSIAFALSFASPTNIPATISESGSRPKSPLGGADRSADAVLALGRVQASTSLTAGIRSHRPARRTRAGCRPFRRALGRRPLGSQRRTPCGC